MNFKHNLIRDNNGYSELISQTLKHPQAQSKMLLTRSKFSSPLYVLMENDCIKRNCEYSNDLNDTKPDSLFCTRL
jgi:hypothetical protein